jgi:hypothetical protein
MAAVHIAMVEPNSDARKSFFIPKLLGSCLTLRLRFVLV